MALADIVHQDRDLFIGDEAGELVIVRVLVCGEVHGQGLDADAGVDLRDCCRYGLQFGRRPRNEQNVVASFRQLQGIFFANAIAAAGYEGPGAAGTEAAKLGRQSVMGEHWPAVKSGGAFTDFPGSMNMLESTRKMLKMTQATVREPMTTKQLVIADCPSKRAMLEALLAIIVV